MAAKLIVKDPDGTLTEFKLTLDTTRIGRAAGQNEIVLHDSRVSRQHARIRSAGRSFVVEDLDSANGTLVNGRPVKGHTLADGEVIAIGSYSLEFRERDSLSVAVVRQEPKAGGTVLMRTPADLGLAGRQVSLPPFGSGEISREEIQTLRKRAETLSMLYELGRVLSSVFSLEEIFANVGEMLFSTTPADRYVVLLKDRTGSNFSTFSTGVREQGRILSPEKISVSQTILDRVVSDRVALLSFDAQADDRLGSSQSILVQHVHSVMCAPLLRQETVLGVIYVDCQQVSKMFTVDHLDMLNAIAVQASMAVDNATTHEQLVKEALARAAYSRFMPRHVVEQVLANPESVSLGGSNQVVTILYSDLRGFTTIAETLDPDVVVKLLNEYFTEMTPLVFDNGGILDKYIGDGLMALFGVPTPSDDSAANAVAAAVQMQRRMVSLRRELREARLPEIAIGIGINTGTATVGYVGSEMRTDYTAIGDSVNLAARLEKVAAAGHIVITRATLDAIGNKFRVRPSGDIVVRGKSMPVPVFEVEW